MSNKVSVIIPVYNGAKYLSATLESVRAQTHDDLELIVVDDGSSDHSVDVARAYEAIIVRQHQQGPGAARNLGVKHATGAHIAFLDQDDLWHPDKLRLQLEVLPTGDYVACRTLAHLEPEALEVASVIRDGYRTGAVAPTPSALLIPRAVFDRVGWFDTRFQTGSDVAWLAKANRLGLRMVYPEPVLLTKRFHKRNQGNDVRLGQQELLQILRESLRERST
jgi:glycosyltransferase involved in cell wall biosynthesis